MSSVTLTSEFPKVNENPSIGQALKELGKATANLISAIASGNFSSKERRALTRAEEAEELRHFAYTLRARDPSFAEDLFAAADRHEWGEEATQ
jgi:hypothetical protein